MVLIITAPHVFAVEINQQVNMGRIGAGFAGPPGNL
jgi:hypothetical protein